MRCVLGPCDRPGKRILAGDKFDDWWREPHVYCTGSHHLSATEVAECSCTCHTSEPWKRCPKTYDPAAACTCRNDQIHREQAARDARIIAEMNAGRDARA